jgi:hypothetical protein
MWLPVCTSPVGGIHFQLSVVGSDAVDAIKAISRWVSSTFFLPFRDGLNPAVVSLLLPSFNGNSFININ